jgi:hypothetical protein
MARHLVLEIDQEVLAEQYRHARMEAFKARMELETVRLKLRHAADRERMQGEQALGVHEARMELLERLVAQTREELIHRTMELVEVETEIDHLVAHQDDHPAEHHDSAAKHHLGEFEGTWKGRDDEGAVIQLHIQGEHARLEVEAENVWFETEFEAQPRDDGLWNVAMRIVDGSEGDYAGQVSLGLAELDGPRLVMALCEPGEDRRPASLNDGENVKVFRFSRR